MANKLYCLSDEIANIKTVVKLSQRCVPVIFVLDLRVGLRVRVPTHTRTL